MKLDTFYQLLVDPKLAQLLDPQFVSQEPDKSQQTLDALNAYIGALGGKSMVGAASLGFSITATQRPPLCSHAALWWISHTLLTAISLHPGVVVINAWAAPTSNSPLERAVMKNNPYGALSTRWNAQPLSKARTSAPSDSPECQAIDVLESGMSLVHRCNRDLRVLPGSADDMLKAGIGNASQVHELLSFVDAKIASQLNARLLELDTSHAEPSFPRPRL